MRDDTPVTFEREATTLVVEVEGPTRTLMLRRSPGRSAGLTRVGERRAEIGA